MHRRDHPGEQEDVQTDGAGRSGGVDRRAGLRVGDRGIAVLKEGGLTRVRADDLMAGLRGQRVGRGDRARADDLVFRRRLARELAFRAGEADAAVARSVGTVGRARTIVERLIAQGRDDGCGLAERADHVAVGRPGAVDLADIRAIDRQLFTEAVAVLHFAAAVGDAVEDDAFRAGAKRIGLVPANLGQPGRQGELRIVGVHASGECHPE